MRMALFALLSVVVFLAGCAASGPAFVPAENVDIENKALIYVYRPDSLAGGNVTPRIYIDEIDKGLLKNNGYLVCSIRSGTRMIEATSWGAKRLTMYLDVIAGREYYIRWWPESGYLSHCYHMKVIRKEDALPEIRHAKKSQ